MRMAESNKLKTGIFSGSFNPVHNILANHRHTLTHLPKGSILTPHPKELERLVGKCQDSYERLMKACELAHTAKVHIILKGPFGVFMG